MKGSQYRSTVPLNGFYAGSGLTTYRYDLCVNPALQSEALKDFSRSGENYWLATLEGSGGIRAASSSTPRERKHTGSMLMSLPGARPMIAGAAFSIPQATPRGNSQQLTLGNNRATNGGKQCVFDIPGKARGSTTPRTLRPSELEGSKPARRPAAKEYACGPRSPRSRHAPAKAITEQVRPRADIVREPILNFEGDSFSRMMGPAWAT
eukprot:TRINITY_DN57992_c0_g2_i1.p1 TRINITY_DN57992_c0_g2~~TRINITY_DN57992_c0_g2_i1.p1  ORF type:complete len:208 (+),score=29.35 TRINITY_DN57992_c0_g2_i1:87-710(+)